MEPLLDPEMSEDEFEALVLPTNRVTFLSDSCIIIINPVMHYHLSFNSETDVYIM